MRRTEKTQVIGFSSDPACPMGSGESHDSCIGARAQSGCEMCLSGPLVHSWPQHRVRPAQVVPPPRRRGAGPPGAGGPGGPGAPNAVAKARKTQAGACCPWREVTGVCSDKVALVKGRPR